MDTPTTDTPSVAEQMEAIWAQAQKSHEAELARAEWEVA